MCLQTVGEDRETQMLDFSMNPLDAIHLRTSM